MPREVHITESHPSYKAINYLQNLLVLVTNPFMHFLGFGLGSTPIEQATQKFNDEADAAGAKQAILEAQQRLLDKV